MFRFALERYDMIFMDIEKYLGAGMNVHVGKPLGFDGVLRKMKRYLHQ